MMTRYVQYIAVFAMLLTLVGCAREKARVARPEYMTPQEHWVKVALEKRQNDIRTIRALGKLTSLGNDEFESDAVLVIALPDRMRLETMDSLADVTLAAAVDGTRMWVWLPMEGKVYRGRASRKNMKRVANIDWETQDLISAFAGVIGVGDGDVVEQGAESSVFQLRDRDIAVRMNLKKGLPTELVGPRYEVRYERYRDVGGIPFPHRIVAQTLDGNSRIVIEYGDVKLNDEISDDVFRAPQ